MVKVHSRVVRLDGSSKYAIIVPADTTDAELEDFQKKYKDFMADPEKRFIVLRGIQMIKLEERHDYRPGTD